MRQAALIRPKAASPGRLTLRVDGPQQWKVQWELGGGTANGQITLQPGKDGRRQLIGRLTPQDIDVAAALDAFKAHSAVRRKATGHTQVSASGEGLAQLIGSLHTRTQFTMASAQLLHIDVDKAIRSFGKDRAGQTPLRSLAGQMDTQNTPQGMVVRFSGLRATGETFSAEGEGSIANRRVQGEMTVKLAGGLVGVPMKVSGPLAQPQITVPATAVAGAAAGAAVGTAVLPGIGTAIGAGVGSAVGKLFGGAEAKPSH